MLVTQLSEREGIENSMVETVSRQEQRDKEIESVFERYKAHSEKGGLFDKLNPLKAYQQYKALESLQKASDAKGLDDTYGGDYATNLGMAKSRLQASGVEFPEEKPTLTDEQYAEKKAEIDAIKAKMEEKYFAQDALASERSMMSKVNPKHVMASAKVIKGFDELNQMLKGAVEDIHIYDAKMMLSMIDENIEKAGIDMEAYNARVEEQLSQHKAPEYTLDEESESLAKGSEELSPLESYKKELESEFEVVDQEQVRGVYRIKVRQSMAEQVELEAGHSEMVNHPEIDLEDKIDALTEVAAKKAGIEIPEHSKSDVVLDRVNEYSQAMDEKLKTPEKGDEGRVVAIER